MIINPYVYAMGGGDPYFANVVSLLHLDGSNGATSITDITGKAWTANANAQISTAQSKFGGASALFDGDGDYFSTPNHADFNFGTGDFTVEAWVYKTSSGDDAILTNYQNASAGWVFQTYVGKLIFNCTGDGVDATSTNNLPLNQWVHVAAARAGTTLKLFMDGVQEASVTDSSNISSTAALVLGGFPGYASSTWPGYIDDARITKGVARYTAAFTPPMAAFPDS